MCSMSRRDSTEPTFRREPVNLIVSRSLTETRSRWVSGTCRSSETTAVISFETDAIGLIRFAWRSSSTVPLRSSIT